MNGVWSYWSPPAGPDHRARWASSFHHLLSWALSVNLARRWFDRSVLVTDSDGARLLVDALGLPFDEVSCVLDRVPCDLQRWWALGKLQAYAAQSAPFIHLDSDVYLWRPLPSRVLTASVVGQNPERFPFDRTDYLPAELVGHIRSKGGWVPEELSWYSAHQGNEACCCGIFGGTRLDFIREYAHLAVELIERNGRSWTSLRPGADYNIVAEQYLLSAFHYYHSRRAKYADVEIAYLFASESEAYDDRMAAAAGFTHLMGDAKHHPLVLARLEARVQRDFPGDYAAACNVVAAWSQRCR